MSRPQLPDDPLKTADAMYGRFQGASRWYRYDYPDAELKTGAEKICTGRAKEIRAYFNNDLQGCAFRNAQTLKWRLG